MTRTITYLTIGSDGDVRPCVALAHGLHAAGYDVRVATHRRFEPLVRSYGLDFYPVAGDPREFLQDEDIRRWAERCTNPLQQIRAIIEAIRPAIRQGLQDHWDACRGTDVVLYQGLSRFPGHMIGESLGVPAYPAHVLPFHPLSGFPRATGSDVEPRTRAVNRVYNRCGPRLGDLLMWQFVRRFVNEWRRDCLRRRPLLALGPTRDIYRIRPWVYSLSRHLLPTNTGWPEGVHCTGYWFLDRPGGWQPPADLVAFLEGGPPPIYVGFGSMVTRDPPGDLAVVLDAVGRTGQRAVVMSGYGGLDGRRVPESVFLVPSVPHDWLFPRVAAVVHHGGSGTTARGLWAGLPTVTVPFFGDQRLWSTRVVALGVGPQPIPHAELTAERLAAAIREATGNAAMRERARTLGERLRAEDGVARAVEILDRDIRRRLA